MVLSQDIGINNQPNYNAVKISVKNPSVNGTNNCSECCGNGVYNAVNIDIENPSVNSTCDDGYFYSYPQASTPITYDMANIAPVELPQGFFAYQTTNVIIPKKDFSEAGSDEKEEVSEEVLPPEPYYTTVEAEKYDNEEEIIADKKNNIGGLSFKAEETKKTPEIVPAEPILPKVDISLIVSNLSGEDFDTQAMQMEEIVRLSLDNSENAIPYIVREVYSSLINIAEKDTTALPAPTREQIDARRKIVANFIAAEQASANNSKGDIKLPFNISEQEIQLANSISPMEQAERNKEYALYTMAVLDKVYINEIEKQTGNIVPLTDIPGISTIIDSLRYSKNAGVKIASIESLGYIKRPEYSEELNTILQLAMQDTDPMVAEAAAIVLRN